MNFFVNAIKNGFKNSFLFSGKTSRLDFWCWIIFVIAFVQIAIALDITYYFKSYKTGIQSYGPIQWAIWLIVIIPTFSIAIRRLHDANASIWWLITYLIFFYVAYEYLCITRGDDYLRYSTCQILNDFQIKIFFFMWGIISIVLFYFLYIKK